MKKYEPLVHPNAGELLAFEKSFKFLVRQLSMLLTLSNSVITFPLFFWGGTPYNRFEPAFAPLYTNPTEHTDNIRPSANGRDFTKEIPGAVVDPKPKIGPHEPDALQIKTRQTQNGISSRSDRWVPNPHIHSMKFLLKQRPDTPPAYDSSPAKLSAIDISFLEKPGMYRYLPEHKQSSGNSTKDENENFKGNSLDLKIPVIGPPQLDLVNQSPGFLNEVVQPIELKVVPGVERKPGAIQKPVDASINKGFGSKGSEAAGGLLPAAETGKAGKGTGNFPDSPLFSSPLIHSIQFLSMYLSRQAPGILPGTVGAGGARQLSIPMVACHDVESSPGDDKSPLVKVVNHSKRVPGYSHPFRLAIPLTRDGTDTGSPGKPFHAVDFIHVDNVHHAHRYINREYGIAAPYLHFVNRSLGFLNNLVRPLVLRVLRFGIGGKTAAISHGMDVSDGILPGFNNPFETVKTVENIKMAVVRGSAENGNIVSPFLPGLAIGSRYVQTCLSPLTFRISTNVYPGTPAVTAGIGSGRPDRKAGITRISVTDVTGSIGNREVLRGPAIVSPSLTSLAVCTRYIQNQQNRLASIEIFKSRIARQNCVTNVQRQGHPEWPDHWNKEELWFFNNLLQVIHNVVRPLELKAGVERKPAAVSHAVDFALNNRSGSRGGPKHAVRLPANFMKHYLQNQVAETFLPNIGQRKGPNYWNKEELRFFNNFLPGIDKSGLSTAVIVEKIYKTQLPGKEADNTAGTDNSRFKERSADQKVTNTFNITVNTPLPGTGDHGSPLDLEETLAGILKDEARRYGIKV